MNDHQGSTNAPAPANDMATVKSEELAVMFADVSGSTRLYERLGDETALEKVTRCLAMASSITRDNKGRVVKTIGDEVLCTFPTCADAISAACVIHDQLAGLKGVDDEAGNRLAMRIGIHVGVAILEDGDVFGDAINVAARMTAQAKARQTVVSGAVRGEISPMLKSCTRYVDRAMVKGKQEAMEMYEFICHPDDATVLAELTLSGGATTKRTLLLRCGDESLEVSEHNPSVLAGRDSTCDLVVNEMTASRHHMRVELRKNRLVLVDQSTNGTYILPDLETVVFARRDEIALEGSGLISLGCSFKHRPKAVITYEVKEGGR